MWNDRNPSLLDDCYESKVITGKHPPLLVFLSKGTYGNGSVYTVNLFTMKPTANSQLKTPLTDELKSKLTKLRVMMSKKVTPMTELSYG